jgi:hypothetical protein
VQPNETGLTLPRALVVAVDRVINDVGCCGPQAKIPTARSGAVYRGAAAVEATFKRKQCPKAVAAGMHRRFRIHIAGKWPL